MRGFQQKKVKIDGELRPALEAFDLHSAASGGAFPSMVYHYAQYTTSDELLDAAGNSDPSKITMEDLEKIPEKSLFTKYTTKLDPSILIAVLYTAVFGAPSLWPLVESFHFLQPHGIAMGTKMSDAKIRDDVKSTPIFTTSMIGPSDAFPNYVYEYMNRGFMNEFKNEYKNHLEKFKYFSNEHFLMNNDYVLELAEKHNYHIPLPAFITDQGLNVPFAHDIVMNFDDVENKTANAVEFKPVDATFAELQSTSDPFTLEKTLAMATDVMIIFNFLSKFPPNLQNPISVAIPTADGGKREMTFSDGGYNDFVGIPPLVQKKTKKIISIWNPSAATSSRVDQGPAFASMVPNMVDQFGQFFGLLTNWNTGFHFTAGKGTDFAGQCFTNYIFNMLGSDGENHLVKLTENMLSLQAAGEPMITTLKNVEVVDNPFWGIEGGWTLEITIIFGLGVPKKFAERIPDGIVTPPLGKDIVEDGYFTNEEFSFVPQVNPAPKGAVNITLPIPGTKETIEFPSYTVGYDLPTKAARMTQIMNSWIIDRAWDGLIGDDGKEKFGGFRKLFEGDQDNTSSAKNIYVTDQECATEDQCKMSRSAPKATKAPKSSTKASSSSKSKAAKV